MRKLAVLAAMVGALAWSSAAFAVEANVPIKQEDGTPYNGGSVDITNAKTGEKIGHGTINNGTAHITLKENVPPDTPVKVEVHKTPTSKPTEIKDKTLGGVLTGIVVPVTAAAGGLAAATNAGTKTTGTKTAASNNLRQIGLAVHNPTTPVLNRAEFFFGAGAVFSQTQTNANGFGPGIGFANFSDNSWTNSFMATLGADFPIMPGLTLGPVVNLITGPLNVPTVSQVTPTGVSAHSQVYQSSPAIDVMGRVSVRPWTGGYLVLFGEAGMENATYTGTMVNDGIETFIGHQNKTSLIAGGGVMFGLCPLVALSDPSGQCPLQMFVEYDHVANQFSFFTGITPGSSATASANGENRVVVGLNFYSPMFETPADVVQQGPVSPINVFPWLEKLFVGTTTGGSR